MARLRVTVEKELHKAVRETAAVLESGGVAIFPTETVYGIGVLSGEAEALEKLRRLKGRADDKPFQLLASDMDMAAAIGARFGSRAQRLARTFWPGPLTLVVPDGTGFGTLGIRVPASPFVLAVLRELDRPIVSSSANPAGAPPPITAESADVFGDDVDILVDAGPATGGVPSTVVRCGDDAFEILRSGGVADAAIADAWEEG